MHLNMTTCIKNCQILDQPNQDNITGDDKSMNDATSKSKSKTMIKIDPFDHDEDFPEFDLNSP